MSAPRIAIIGLGTMGRAIAARLVESAVASPDQLRATVRRARHAAELDAELPFPVTADNRAVAAWAEVVLLCTKPKGCAPVLTDLRDSGSLDHNPLVISIAAGETTAALEAAAGPSVPVVRAMPNTPCVLGEGMVVLSAGHHSGDAEIEVARTLLQPLGRVLSLDEEHMDAVTGLSGSGPAFVYVIIEALAEGGVMTGLPRAVATELAAQTVKGAARMVLETGRHPAALKDDVTTPAGCTISALLALEDGRLRSVLARGVQEAARSASGLGTKRTEGGG